MEKIKLTTTIQLLNNKLACCGGMETLLDYLANIHPGEDYPNDKEINLLTILESNGVNHCVWAFRAAQKDFTIVKPYLISIARDAIESVLHSLGNKYQVCAPPISVIRMDYYFNVATTAKTASAATTAVEYVFDYAAEAYIDDFSVERRKQKEIIKNHLTF